MQTKDMGPVGKGGVKSRYINGTLVFDSGPLFPGVKHTKRTRVAIASVNAGATLLSAIPGYKYRLLAGTALVAIGGNVGTVTTIDILGTQSTSSVKLLAAAQANLTRSAVLRPGGTGGAVLADGASFAACDVNKAITIGITGSAADTATHIDVLLEYTIEKA